MSQPAPHPLDRLAAHGGTDYRACIPRADNPFNQGDPVRETWFSQWDAAAHEAARILKANAGQRLYRAALSAVSLLRDMRNSPRTITPRSPRYRDVEVDLNTAVSCALAASGAQQSIAGVPVNLSSEG